ncbi:MAG: CDP-glucose 4,6-dehydratase [bacterium]|nr:CDP-glucose 4,6-dehydratase [bacterium]
MFNNSYKNKVVLVTGHTGFKGSWLSIWLKELGANVIGYALEPYTKDDNFVVTNLKEKITHIIGDVRDYKKLKAVFDKYKPEFVFHLAAQSLVIESYKNPRETYETNILGTVNIFEAAHQTNSVKVIINVTSDKCYDNKGWVWGYRENDPMGGYDPYSSSKGCSELVTAAYRNSFFNPQEFEKHAKSLSSVRSGNVIGGGDWRKHRIIPDCVRAFKKGEPIEVRNPDAIRPWQHVLEPLWGYLLLGSKMYEKPKKYCGAWNFGPNSDSIITVRKLVELFIKKYGQGSWRTAPDESPHEIKTLTLDINKARTYLNWSPIWSIEKCIEKTVEWYKKSDKDDLYDICVAQINDYISDMEKC